MDVDANWKGDSRDAPDISCRHESRPSTSVMANDSRGGLHRRTLMIYTSREMMLRQYFSFICMKKMLKERLCKVIPDDFLRKISPHIFSSYRSCKHGFLPERRYEDFL